MALVVGFAQCIAMWPGVSRSLVTIVGGLMVGLSLPAAVEYSFLLGVVTLGAATAYDALKQGQIMLQTFEVLPIAVGLLFAFISAVVSVKWMVAYLNRHGLAVFGYYRIAIALATSAWLSGRDHVTASFYGGSLFQNVSFRSRSRRATISTTGAAALRRGLKCEPVADIGRNGGF